ncbi:protein kinase domain-containing protein [Thermogemmatispora carboxidivorans]|uniref:protein kinase domain-containing protein n=1 Tax=Thermogemmatispora carboxidivorans TaxID=1382306 RepID=UPI00069B1471|nr:protein kinase [Thermogemmatispora carboxidivorans]
MLRCPNPRCQASYPDGTFQCSKPFCQCLLPGAVVAGRYTIGQLLGLGGMGAVYRARDGFDEQEVALKILSLHISNMDISTAVERFKREARYAHQLRHRNIVPVLNFGQDGRLLYLAMPLVTGGTLKALLKDEKPLSLELALRYLGDLAEAVDAVHAHPQRIVHRDIKPSNLLIHQDDGRLVLTDFGIARAMEKEVPLTQRGWALGTQHYIAPEQEKGHTEPASDIYSMGVVAYQMFTGLLPFQAIVRSHSAELPPPSQLNSALNPGVDAAILRAMHIDPAQRWPSARAFAEAVKEALVEAPTVIVPPPERSSPLRSGANVLVRTLIPENPCGACGRENRPGSRYCRHCGQTLNGTSPLVIDVCQVGYISDVGRRYVAQDNEDMLLIVQGLGLGLGLPPRPFGLFGVADGLRGPEGRSIGGHEASHLAIATVADVLIPRLTALPLRVQHGTNLQAAQQAEFWLRESVLRANQVIYHSNADYNTFMASTLTVALLHCHYLYVASVGDSRAYHFIPGRGLERITRDHSLAANLVEAELLAPDDLYSSARRHRLYRYLGLASHLQMDFFSRQVAVGDLILLCTDGLWHMLRDERLSELLARGGDLQQLARLLVDEANRAGGEGNISVILVRVQ